MHGHLLVAPQVVVALLGLVLFAPQALLPVPRTVELAHRHHVVADVADGVRFGFLRCGPAQFGPLFLACRGLLGFPLRVFLAAGVGVVARQAADAERQDGDFLTLTHAVGVVVRVDVCVSVLVKQVTLDDPWILLAKCAVKVLQFWRVVYI